MAHTAIVGSHLIEFVGEPTGPSKYVPELGIETPTFVEPGIVPGGTPTLKHHVPVTFRGSFRPKDLANFDSNTEYRTDKYDMLLCYAKTKAGERCKRKAVNRFPRCNVHGGRLHPLDRVAVDPETHNPDGTRKPDESKPLSRYQLFLAKKLTVDDLDDEELMNFGFRDANGRIFKPKNIPRDVVHTFTRGIYDRALHELKVNAVEATKTLASIMTDASVDAGIRLRAAEAILDRTLGKAPQVVAITGTAAWEEVFEGIAPITREDSRRARGTDNSHGANSVDEILDAEIVPALPMSSPSRAAD